MSSARVEVAPANTREVLRKKAERQNTVPEFLYTPHTHAILGCWRMRIGIIFICFSLISVGIQPPIDFLTNTDGPTFPLEVSTNKYYYAAGESVEIELTNVGDESIFLTHLPPDLYIVDTALRIVVDTRACIHLLPVIEIPPGDSFPHSWNQSYRVCEVGGNPIPPSGYPVPEGRYLLSAGMDHAWYENQSMPIWDSVWIEIGPAGDTPVADAGPDQTVNVGDIVQFDGSNSSAPEGDFVFGNGIRINNDATTYPQTYPAIDVDKADNVHIVWADERDYLAYYKDIYYSRSIDNGQSFQPNVRVNKDTGKLSQHSTVVRTNDNLDVLLGWVAGEPVREVYFAKSTDNGQSFGSEVVVNDPDGEVGIYIRGLDIGSHGTSQVFMAWQDIRNVGTTESDIYFSNSTDNGVSFGRDVKVNDDVGGGYQNILSMDVDEYGNIYLVWTDGRNLSTDVDIYFSKSTDGGTSFSSNVKVNDDNLDVSQSSPSVAVDDEGNINVVWFDYRIWGDPDIYFARSTDGGQTFGPDVRVNDDALSMAQAYPDIDVNQYGDIYVVWEDWRDGDYDIFLSLSTDGGKTFRKNMQVNSFSASNQDSARIAVDSEGKPHVVWRDYRDDTGDIYYSRGTPSLGYDWDFGDGSPHETVARPTHTYNIPGVYNVTLTVTNTTGANDTDYCQVTVVGENLPPVAYAGPDQTVNEGDIVQFDGTGSQGGGSGTGNWTWKAFVPSFRMDGGSATLNDEAYFIGGVGSPDGMGGLTVKDTVEKYNPADDAWYTVTSLPEPRFGLGAAAVGGKIYAIGGNDGTNSTKTTFEFDPFTNAWTTKAPMPMELESFGIATVNDKIYVMGGHSTLIFCYPCGEVYEYDPSSDSWTQKADLPTGRSKLAAATLDGKVYAIGGDAYGLMDEVEVYDPATDNWTVAADMIGPRSHLRAEALGGNIYVMGGYEDLGAPWTVHVYNPSLDNWTILQAQLVEPRIAPGSGVVDSCVYLFGGNSGHMIGILSLNEEYCLDGELEYEWDFDANMDSDGDGNYTNDVDATGEAPTHVYGDNGNYTVTLKVTDGSGLSDTDNVSVTVLNVAPTASVGGPYLGFEGTPLLLMGSHTDPGFLDTHVYEWDLSYDGTTFIPDMTGEFVQNTWYDDYYGSIALKVTDDDGGWDLDVTTVTIANVPPIANAGDDKEGLEVSTFTFNGGFYDPGANDTHTFEWDFDYDGINFDVEAIGQSASHTFIDDFDGEVAVRVTDDDGGVGIDTAHVLVNNVPPTVTLEVLPIEVDAFLRIAGEKWHDVTIELYEDGVLIANGTLVRYPGSPDEQMLNLSNLQFDYSKNYTATIRYTPDDDPINGQPNGANPCWIILRFSDGQELWINHTFNVQHPDTYVWEVDLTAAILSLGLTFKAIAFDPGADDLTFHWDFGDGTTLTSFYPNVLGTYPVEIIVAANHAFPGSGTFVVVLTVQDDDRGVGTASLTIVIP
jgi:N-acetylneuraminic acid mutarotase